MVTVRNKLVIHGQSFQNLSVSHHSSSNAWANPTTGAGISSPGNSTERLRRLDVKVQMEVKIKLAYGVPFMFAGTCEHKRLQQPRTLHLKEPQLNA